jgi:hypothetical protein
MARLNSMYNSIGSMATKMLYGTQSRPTVVNSTMAKAAIAASRAHGGIGGAAIANMVNSRAAIANNVKMGRKVVGGAAAMGMMGMANRPSPVGGYNPRRPVVPVPQNGRPI